MDSVVKILGLLIFVFIILFIYQSLSTLIDNYRYPPSGRLVDIGGYKLHLDVRGEGQGKITVVCDAGLGGTSLGWSLVQAEVSKFARICSYDRAGYAWSDPSSSKRTSINIANELHLLLEKAKVSGPYILVGHSFGGANMMVFADLYPEETIGVILVDSVHEDMLKKLPNPSQKFFDKIISHSIVQGLLAASGYKRLKGQTTEIGRMFFPLSEPIRNAYYAQMNKTGYTQIVSKEMDCLEESLLQLARCHIQDKPLIIITAGIASSSEEGKIWKELQKNLLFKSNKSKQIVAENSDHMINHHQPQIIVDAIKELVNSFSVFGNPKNGSENL
ncbi:MAG TPA: alpha/beta hydrolase [Waddliaceae bacterium]